MSQQRISQKKEYSVNKQESSCAIWEKTPNELFSIEGSVKKYLKANLFPSEVSG